MRKLSSTLKYQHFALVEASSVFGILDNMRYDRACPFEEHDASVLERFLTGGGTYLSCRFVITKWSESKIPMWTFIRWRSGNCLEITPLDSEQALHAERALWRSGNLMFTPIDSKQAFHAERTLDEGSK